MGRNRSLSEIKNFLLSKDTYDRDYVLEIMNDPDLNRPGLLTEMWSDSEVWRKLGACFSIKELSDFFCEYSKQSIIQNKESEIVSSPYIAGHELVNWVRWMRKYHNGEFLNHFVLWLEDFYRTYAEDEQISDCIVAGILEHLFEDVEIRSRFDYWKNDPELREAYDSAEDWIK